MTNREIANKIVGDAWRDGLKDAIRANITMVDRIVEAMDAKDASHKEFIGRLTNLILEEEKQ